MLKICPNMLKCAGAIYITFEKMYYRNEILPVVTTLVFCSMSATPGKTV